jgi:biotin carboxylase
VVGPPPEVRELTGGKVAARGAFEDSGFPVLPGVGPFLDADDAAATSAEVGVPLGEAKRVERPWRKHGVLPV